jgi:hypothetical protein
MTGSRGLTLPFALAAMAVGMVLLAGSRMDSQSGRAELVDGSLAVSFRSSVHELRSVDARHGKHPSLKDTAFLAQLSSVLSARSGDQTEQRPMSHELSRTQSLENLDLRLHPDISARTTSLSDSASVAASDRSAGGWCHCADEAGCECSHGAGGSLRSRDAKTVSLAMNCCQCDGSMVSLPAVPCADCHECGSKAFSPYYNPYGVRKSATARKTSILSQQQHRVWSAKNGREKFWKEGERKSAPTDGMRALNKIIAGARRFVRPPPTKDVYEVVKQTFVKKDPLVAAS